MNLVKWDPIKELEAVSNRLNHLFGRSRIEPNQETFLLADWTPNVDISETDDSYLIKGEIPGVKKEDVKITIENNMITLRGERQQEKEEKGEKYHRVERSYGNFMRSFMIPDDADESGVKAEFKDGMINITLPKSAKAKGTEVVVH
jgi:HSP20 family protein